MDTFRELVEGAMDGGNAGEYNQARAEQKEQNDARAKGEEAINLAKQCMQILYSLTGKKWPYNGQAQRYGYTEQKQTAMLKNPGRLKGWKNIKKEYDMDPYEKELATALKAKEIGGIPINYKLGKVQFQLGFVGKSRDLEIFVTKI